MYNVGFNYYDLHIVRDNYTKEEGTIHEHCFAKTIYCYNSIVWIMIGSEKLNILSNILFFSKVFWYSNGIFNLPLLVFDLRLIWRIGRQSITLRLRCNNKEEFECVFNMKVISILNKTNKLTTV